MIFSIDQLRVDFLSEEKKGNSVGFGSLQPHARFCLTSPKIIEYFLLDSWNYRPRIWPAVNFYVAFLWRLFLGTLNNRRKDWLSVSRGKLRPKKTEIDGRVARSGAEADEVRGRRVWRRRLPQLRQLVQLEHFRRGPCLCHWRTRGGNATTRVIRVTELVRNRRKARATLLSSVSTTSKCSRTTNARAAKIAPSRERRTRAKPRRRRKHAPHARSSSPSCASSSSHALRALSLCPLMAATP